MQVFLASLRDVCIASIISYFSVFFNPELALCSSASKIYTHVQFKMPLKQPPLPKQGQIIIRGDDFDESYIEYLYSDIGKKISKWLNQKTNKISDTGASYRTINHWCELGLVDDERKGSEQGWRVFSRLDLAWLRVIEQMRIFGLSLTMISDVHRSLFSSESRRNLFQFYLTKGCSQSSYLLIFEDGNAELASQAELERSQGYGLIYNHLSIDLRPIWARVTGISISVEDNTESVRLSHEEIGLLLLVREGRYESVTVHFKNGKAEMLESKEAVTTQKRIVELLKDGAYQDIELKQQDGKIVSLKRTIKKKLSPKATEDLRVTSTKSSRPSDKPKSGADDFHAHR